MSCPGQQPDLVRLLQSNALSYPAAAIGHVIESAGGLVGQLATQVVRYIQQTLESAQASVAGFATKVASPIVQAINLGESTVQSMANLAVNSASACVQTAVGCFPPYTTSQPCAPGYNETREMWGVFCSGGNPPVVEVIQCSRDISGQGKTLVYGPTDQVLAAQIAALRPCQAPQPGQPPFQPPPPPSPIQPQAPCPNFDRLQAASSAGEQAFSSTAPDGQSEDCRWIIWAGTDCVVHAQTFTDLGFALPGPIVSYRVLVDLIGQQNQAFAGADAAASILAWSVVKNPQVGSCGPPPPPIITPPPPPPTGPCPPGYECVPITPPPPPPPPPPTTGCVPITFCDWEKLCDTLKQCIKLIIPKQPCALDNEAAWLISDCEKDIDEKLGEWFGERGAVVTGIKAYDELVMSSVDELANPDPNDFVGPDIFEEQR